MVDVDDLLATHQGAFLTHDLTYTPKGGAPLSIKGLIRREGVDPTDESQQYAYRSATVRVRNHATLGVVTPKKGDTIAGPFRAGAADSTAVVTGILSSNSSLHLLEVQEQ